MACDERSWKVEGYGRGRDNRLYNRDSQAMDTRRMGVFTEVMSQSFDFAQVKKTDAVL